MTFDFFYIDIGIINIIQCMLIRTFPQIDNAYRRLLEKFSSERWNVNKCEGEYGLYYEQKRKWREMETEEEDDDNEEEKEKDFGIKVREGYGKISCNDQ